MTALTEGVALIEEQITTYDAAVTQLAAAQTALTQAQSDMEEIRDNTALSVAERAKKMVLSKATIDILESDVSRQQSALAVLRTQTIADSTALQARFRGELGNKIAALIQTTVASLQTDFDTSRIMFPVAQIAAAHRDVVALRGLENSLLMHRPGDAEYITFARGSRALLTQIG